PVLGRVAQAPREAATSDRANRATATAGTAARGSHGIRRRALTGGSPLVTVARPHRADWGDGRVVQEFCRRAADAADTSHRATRSHPHSDTPSLRQRVTCPHE